MACHDNSSAREAMHSSIPTSFSRLLVAGIAATLCPWYNKPCSRAVQTLSESNTPGASKPDSTPRSHLCPAISSSRPDISFNMAFRTFTTSSVTPVHSYVSNTDNATSDTLTAIWIYLRASTSRGYRASSRDQGVFDPASGSDNSAPRSQEETAQIREWIELLDELVRKTGDSIPPPALRHWFIELFGSDNPNTFRIQNGRHPEDFRPLISVFVDMLRKLCRIHRVLPSSFILPRGIVTTTQSKPGQSARPIGSGGFGEVWKGLCQGGAVAVKVMKGSGESASVASEMTLCEAVVWKYLNHPNITPFYGIDMSNARLSLVSKWMEHGTVREYLRDNPSADRLTFVVHVVEGLNYLHDMGVVHGDIKSVNILVNERRAACLVDFGLAAVNYDGQLDTRSAAGSSLRWTAPEVMHPEHYGLTKATLSKETDIYSLSLTIWEANLRIRRRIFTGNIPFHEHMRDATVMHHILEGHRPQRPNYAESNGLDDSLWGLMERCWHPNRDERPTIGSIQACIIYNPAGNPVYYVRLDPLFAAAGVELEHEPVDTAVCERLAQPFSEWLASYVWRMCTTGFSLSPAYAPPGYDFTLLSTRTGAEIVTFIVDSCGLFQGI
ncbi:kinase-like protein [Obba rivulosa]|uniref:Kinase-like protein n=1 Tax=Obba rivulosa TaxID=1052685 RepID=A0A8E2AMZ9_9APHY|nr:kinase-like protein [Obba rivulosa]